MKVIAVDDEVLLLEDFVSQLERIEEIEEVKSFTIEDDVIEYVKENHVDVAMLDVQMPGMGGIQLAEVLNSIQSNINIIFITGYSEHALAAMKLHASGYLIKPPSQEEIVEELHKLRYPVINQEAKRIRVNTFGYFDVYIDNKPISFCRKRAKELLAYLVHINGETVTRKQLAAVLFEDAEYDRKQQKQLQKVLDDLKKVLQENNMADIVIRGNNSFSVNKELFDCDLYDFLNQDINAKNKFHGHYMENYSWGEEMTGVLVQKKER